MVGADDFLTGPYELFPSEAPSVLRTIRARFRRPSMTPSEFLLDLTRCGLPKLAALARRDVEFL